jgi:L-ribulose-5-phosphate 4-epimerase
MNLGIELERNKIYGILNLAAQRAYARGIQTGSGGNLSARDIEKGHMIVKASGGSFADCTGDGEGFVITDFSGKRVDEDGPKPTREVLLHGMLYSLSDKVGGVMHCHSPWAIAYAYNHDVLPMTTLHVKLKLGHDIPILDVDSPMLLEEHIPLVRELFEKNPKLTAFILRAHGVVAVGKDILEAEHTAELIEETAQIAVLRTLLEKNP